MFEWDRGVVEMLETVSRADYRNLSQERKALEADLRDSARGIPAMAGQVQVGEFARPPCLTSCHPLARVQVNGMMRVKCRCQLLVRQKKQTIVRCECCSQNNCAGLCRLRPVDVSQKTRPAVSGHAVYCTSQRSTALNRLTPSGGQQTHSVDADSRPVNNIESANVGSWELRGGVNLSRRATVSLISSR